MIFPHYGDSYALVNSAHEGCHLCSVLYSTAVSVELESFLRMLARYEVFLRRESSQIENEGESHLQINQSFPLGNRGGRHSPIHAKISHQD
jgi:hypothetical protein